MPLKTGEEYRESLKQMKTVVYVGGRKVDRFYEHPVIKPAVNTVAKGYELAHDPHHRDFTTATSYLTGNPINRFNYVATSGEELIKRERQIKLASHMTGQCVYQCTGTDAINAAAATVYEVDEAEKTEYNQRFNAWLRNIHENDLTVTGALTDVKGDRSKRPGEQADPDLFLRVVDKRWDGIVVRGAKIFQSGAAVVHEHLVFPCQTIRRGEEPYAVLFAVPADAKGVVHIHQYLPGDAMRMIGDEMDFGNIQYGAYSTQMIIFDNVFVPWDRVFLCGETEFTNRLVERFGRIHRCVSCSCTSGWIDLFIGVAQALAEYNGVAKKEHIKDKITQMTFLSGRAFACGIAAAAEGSRTPSGVYLPEPLMSNIGKLDGSLAINEARRLGSEICGGISAVLPLEKDYRSPEIGPYLEEFLRGVSEVSTEERLRMAKLAQHLFFGCGLAESKISGSGPSQVQKVMIYALADLQMKMRRARVLCGIEEEESAGRRAGHGRAGALEA